MLISHPNSSFPDNAEICSARYKIGGRGSKGGRGWLPSSGGASVFRSSFSVDINGNGVE